MRGYGWLKLHDVWTMEKEEIGVHAFETWRFRHLFLHGSPRVPQTFTPAIFLLEYLPRSSPSWI